MTLDQITAAALEQLGRGNDALTRHAWQDKCTQLANEGLMDLGAYLDLVTTETVTAESGGLIRLSALSRPARRVLYARRNGRILPVGPGPESGTVRTLGGGETEITYLYLPRLLSNGTDEPDLPEQAQMLLPLFICMRECSTGDEKTQTRADRLLQLYREGRAAARKACPRPEEPKIRIDWRSLC